MELRLGCALDVPLQRLQGFLGLLYSRQVDVDVAVTHLPSAVQMRQLRAGELDLGVVHGTGCDRRVEVEPLYRGEALAAVVPLGHRAAAQATAALDDLAGDVLRVVPHRAEPEVHTRVVELAQSRGIEFRAVREAPGPHVRDLFFAVASDHDVAIAPASALRAAGELGEVVTARPLSENVGMPDTYLAMTRRRRPALTNLYDDARAVARELFRA